MPRFKDIAENLDRALRDVEGATERVVQRASAYVETSLAKAQTRAQGLPAWLALLADVEPLSAPFGLEPRYAGQLDVPSGRISLLRHRVSDPVDPNAPTTRAAREVLHTGIGKAAMLVGRATDAGPARYLVLRFGPETVSLWTLFAENHGGMLHVRDSVLKEGLSSEDFRASLSNTRLVAPGVALAAIGAAPNLLLVREDAWRAVYLGRDARGTLACVVIDLGDERPAGR